jgi:hypothetical protein
VSAPTARPLLLALTLALVTAAPATAQTSFGTADGTLRLPEAVATAPDGTVWVGDHFSGRIQPFRDGRPVVRFPGVTTGGGCGPASSPSIAVRCKRRCSLEARATASTYGMGTVGPQRPLTARLSGRKVVVRASDTTVRTLRSGLFRGG